MNALIIYSGGMDSTVLLHEYRPSIKLAVSFDYGSKHNDMEYEFAKRNTKNLGIKHILIPLDFMNEHFKSDLLRSGGEIPDGHYEHESMKRTVVPFRNGIMLAIAAGIAESNDLDTLLIGNHAGDHAIYPDCRMDFILGMNTAIQRGTRTEVSIFSPYVTMTKRQIALEGQKLGVDFRATYSCYKGYATHCGKCGTCTERKEALLGFDYTDYMTS